MSLVSDDTGRVIAAADPEIVKLLGSASRGISSYEKKVQSVFSDFVTFLEGFPGSHEVQELRKLAKIAQDMKIPDAFPQGVSIRESTITGTVDLHFEFSQFSPRRLADFKIIIRSREVVGSSRDRASEREARYDSATLVADALIDNIPGISIEHLAAIREARAFIEDAINSCTERLVRSISAATRDLVEENEVPADIATASAAWENLRVTTVSMSYEDVAQEVRSAFEKLVRYQQVYEPLKESVCSLLSNFAGSQVGSRVFDLISTLRHAGKLPKAHFAAIDRGDETNALFIDIPGSNGVLVIAGSKREDRPGIVGALLKRHEQLPELSERQVFVSPLGEVVQRIAGEGDFWDGRVFPSRIEALNLIRDAFIRGHKETLVELDSLQRQLLKESGVEGGHDELVAADNDTQTQEGSNQIGKTKFRFTNPAKRDATQNE